MSSICPAEEIHLRPEEQHMWSMKISLMLRMHVTIYQDSTCVTDTSWFCTIMLTGHSRRWTPRRRRNS
ncbi:hypothetical protein LEMLEM_LOCUS11890 [Lemmus lemmus]